MALTVSTQLHSVHGNYFPHTSPMSGALHKVEYVFYFDLILVYKNGMFPQSHFQSMPTTVSVLPITHHRVVTAFQETSYTNLEFPP